MRLFARSNNIFPDAEQRRHELLGVAFCDQDLLPIASPWLRVGTSISTRTREHHPDKGIFESLRGCDLSFYASRARKRAPIAQARRFRDLTKPLASTAQFSYQTTIRLPYKFPVPKCMTAVMLWTDQADLRTYHSHVDNETAIHVTGRVPFSGAAVNKLKYDVMSRSAELAIGISSSLLLLFMSFPKLSDITIASSISETTTLTEHD